jgi:polyisoprenoid-binding protein YceI
MRALVFSAMLALSACATGAVSAPAAAPAHIAAPGATTLPPGADTSLNPADAPAGVYDLDSRHASVVWRIRHLGLGAFTARFDTIAGTLNFDPAAPQNSSISVTIDANSVSTGILNREGQRGFDREIAQALGAEANPTITFVSRSIEVTGPTTGRITGDLTLNGQTRSVTLDATYHGGRYVLLRQKHTIAFAARTMIRRSDWGVTNWGAFAGDEVEILIDAEFIKQ